MTWQYASLGDLVAIKGGGTPSRNVESYWNGGIPWATVKDFKSDVILTTEENISGLGVEESATNVIPKGTIIIPTRMALGKVAIAGTDLAINQDIKALALKNKKSITTDFLFWFLRSSADDFERAGKGATVKGITIDFLKSVQVPLPPLETQKHIARVLEQADQLRKQAQQMESELSQLAQSLFLEMFGDPVSNPMGWQSGTIDDIAVPEKGAVRCGPFGTQLKVNEIVDSGIPLLGIENVVDDQLQDNFEKFLTPAKAKDLKAFSVKPGDVLITRMGTIGRACVVPDSMREARISYHLFRVRVDESKCLPKFLLATISRSGTFQQQLSRLARGAIMAGLNTGVLRQVQLLIPPKKMQEDYIRASDKIEALKKWNETRAQELNAAFQALMQRAFKGKLTTQGTKAA